jgi:SAM-dependent methyltransferase
MVGEAVEYRFEDGGKNPSHAYLFPALRRIIADASIRDRRAFDLGCGAGESTGLLAELGFEVVGVDPSHSGIALAKAGFPGCKFEIGSAYDDLASRYGQFPLVISLEVIEHCFDPHTYASRVYSLVEPGGLFVMSTPYHGYLKNLALAVTGRFDQHFTALWPAGHIKFFSMTTLSDLLLSAGFTDITFERIGRVPVLARSMIAVAHKIEASPWQRTPMSVNLSDCMPLTKTT